MIELRKEDVNKNNTYTWVKINDDGKSAMWRRQFLEEFGGAFDKNGKYFFWAENTKEAPKKEEKVVIRKLIVTKPDGTEDIVENFTKYCRDNNLNKSAMYAVLSGNRSHHKGHKIRKGE